MLRSTTQILPLARIDLRQWGQWTLTPVAFIRWNPSGGLNVTFFTEEPEFDSTVCHLPVGVRVHLPRSWGTCTKGILLLG